jgi:hypothetical protein
VTTPGKPIHTPISPAAIPLDAVARAQIFWCLRRWSSLAYARRAAELLRKFIGGFDGWARQAPPDRTLLARRALSTCYDALAALEEAPGLLLSNQKAGAYAALERAGFLDELEGPAFDNGLQWIEFGYGERERPSTGLFAWAERAIAMTARMKMTVQAQWATTRILSEGPPERFRPRRFPTPLPPLPAVDGPVIEPGEEVPTTGVWVPIDIPNGCPNFLVEAREAPPATVETLKIDIPAWAGDEYSPPEPARTLYDYGELPTRWQLAWEDIRYRTGIEPDESEFLDEDTADPRHPPVHPQPS